MYTRAQCRSVSGRVDRLRTSAGRQSSPSPCPNARPNACPIDCAPKHTPECTPEPAPSSARRLLRPGEHALVGEGAERLLGAQVKDLARRVVGPSGEPASAAQKAAVAHTCTRTPCAPAVSMCLARKCATLFIAYSTLLMSPSWPENVRRQPGWRWSQSLAVWSHDPETNTDGACGIIDTLRTHASACANARTARHEGFSAGASPHGARTS